MDANDIQYLETQVAQAQAAAQDEIQSAQEAVDSMGEARMRVTITLLVIYAVAVVGIGAWAVFGTPEFICETKVDTSCLSGWSETKTVLEDTFTTGVLPLVTLAIGYYFGKGKEQTADA